MTDRNITEDDLPDDQIEPVTASNGADGRERRRGKTV